MIVIGYPGIGKSTLSELSEEYIDLDSSFFAMTYERRPSDWYKIYVHIAMMLSEDHYVVMLPSYKQIREYLAEVNKGRHTIVQIFPALDLYAAWVSKLYRRCKQTDSPRDYRVYVRAVEHYEKDITQLLQPVEGFKNYVITGMDYNLKVIIDNMNDTPPVEHEIGLILDQHKHIHEELHHEQ